MKKFKVLVISMILICLLIACGNNTTAIESVVSETASGIEQKEDNSTVDEQVEYEDNEKNITEDKTVEEEKLSDKEKDNVETLVDDSNQLSEEKDDDINSDTTTDFEVNLFDKSEIFYAQRSMNVRKGPGKEYDITGHFSLNDEVEVLGECKDLPWYEIQYGEEKYYVHSSLVKTDKVDVNAITVQQEVASQQAQPAQQAPVNQTAAVTSVTPKPPVQAASGAAKTVFIGDSRTCQMREATGGAGVVWICEYATKYDWFQNTAIPQADTCIGLGTRVVICMGVNDPGSINNYANLVNQKAADWIGRGASVYYVSLNPVDHPYEDKAPLLDSFNATMPTLLSGVRWIDTASVIKQGGFVLEDGIHYDAAGNATIFNMIYGCLK